MERDDLQRTFQPGSQMMSKRTEFKRILERLAEPESDYPPIRLATTEVHCCRLLVVSGDRVVVTDSVTTRAIPGAYARWDDSEHGVMAQYPQVCYGGGRIGGTVEFARDEANVAAKWAKDVGAYEVTPDQYAEALAAIEPVQAEAQARWQERQAKSAEREHALWAKELARQAAPRQYQRPS